jgi:aerobic carbon-monoxide dehydrogenase large subunit
MVSTIGVRRPPVEDPRLVAGRGRFAADDHPEGPCHLAYLRSPYPHARIARLDVRAAAAAPGVVAVWTAAELGGTKEMARAPFPPPPPLDDRRGQPVLAGGKLCHEGQAFAAVVAESPDAAADALDAVESELEPLPGVAGAATALAPGASPAHEGAPSNVAGRSLLEVGDVDEAFASAPVTLRSTLSLARICGAAMEPRAVTAMPGADGALLVRTSTQSVFAVREAVALALGVEPERVRVLAEDVGGTVERAAYESAQGAFHDQLNAAVRRDSSARSPSG